MKSFLWWSVVAIVVSGCSGPPLPGEARFALLGGTEGQRGAVRAALAEWRAADPSIDVRAVPHGEHDAEIRFVAELYGGALIGETRFEEREIVIDETLTDEHVRRVGLHELGHWLAWSDAHSSDTNDVMHNPVRAEHLTAADVARALR